jgi:hypothetical protein
MKSIKEIINLLLILGLIIVPVEKGFGGVGSIIEKDGEQEGVVSVEGQEDLQEAEQAEQELEAQKLMEEEYYRQQKDLNILLCAAASIFIIYFCGYKCIGPYLNRRIERYRDKMKKG